MKLEEIKGIGARTISLLNKLNIYNSADLFSYYPFRYDIIMRSDISKLNQDDPIIIDGIVENLPRVFRFKGNKDKMNFVINIGKKIINVVIFNRGFLRTNLKIGTKITIIGKYDIKHNLIVASEIRFGLLGNIPKIEPVYHITSGITSKQLNSLINNIDEDVIDYVPSYLCEKYGFENKKSCIKEIHNPIEMNYLKNAINRIKYEELFVFMAKMNYLKMNQSLVGLNRKVDYKLISDFITNLPFKLTDDQLICVDEIYNDLVSSKRMNRLLQGDVGSGKTIVAFISIYINYLSKYQSALMVPTEILALQHYNNLKKLLPNLNICLLTGKLKAKEKKEVYKKIENGEIDVVIGTHALISDNVKYNNLGLVITDEQHRFGVNQRGNLRNKGIVPDILYMSATPIPRTYALTLYGDMSISSIKNKPFGRKETITYLRKNSEIKDVLESMYDELKANHQIYVVVPLIEESDKIDLENIKTIEEKMNLAFGKLYKIGVLHGKMNNADKDKIMDQFKKNEIQILISTTVIEVGVDVGNATMMVVFDSYRFGLSALHQLRGRVGRNELQSYFILVSDRENERLKVLVNTSDGFKISEEDFKMRGSGDLFGVRQSGDMNFKMANFKRDYNVLLKANDDSKDFLMNHFNESSIKTLIEETNCLN